MRISVTFINNMIDVTEHCWCDYDWGNIIEPSYEYIVKSNRYRNNVEYVKTFKDISLLIAGRESAVEYIKNSTINALKLFCSVNLN